MLIRVDLCFHFIFFLILNCYCYLLQTVEHSFLFKDFYCIAQIHHFFNFIFDLFVFTGYSFIADLILFNSFDFTYF